MTLQLKYCSGNQESETLTSFTKKKTNPNQFKKKKKRNKYSLEKITKFPGRQIVLNTLY